MNILINNNSYKIYLQLHINSFIIYGIYLKNKLVFAIILCLIDDLKGWHSYLHKLTMQNKFKFGE